MTPSLSIIGIAASFAVLLAAPTTRAQDWEATVAKACEHRRYAMRRAVSKRIAQAGDAPVAAIRSYDAEHGQDRIPLLLVDAIATADTHGPAVLELLTDWAKNREFYWRAQALAGLARRKLERLRPLHLEAVRDASWLYRLSGAQGLHQLDPARDRAVLDELIATDPDPRLRVRLAGFLFDHGDRRAAGVLVAALELQHEFLGDPWGKREADRALRSLRKAVPDAKTQVEFREALRRDEPDWHEPATHTGGGDYVGGVGVRSCRHGDLFLRWNAGGEVFAGLLPGRAVQLDEDAWRGLLRGLDDLGTGAHEVHGRVVCDYLEMVCGESPHRVKCAPSALPSNLRRWLAELASALGTTDTPDLADELTGRLGQFARPKDQ